MTPVLIYGCKEAFELQSGIYAMSLFFIFLRNYKCTDVPQVVGHRMDTKLLHKGRNLILETGHSHPQRTTQSSPLRRQTVGSASQPAAASPPGPGDPTCCLWDLRCWPLLPCCLWHFPLLHSNCNCTVVIRQRLAVYVKT